jgi:hypothetical protein
MPGPWRDGVSVESIALAARWRVLQRHQPSLGEMGNGGRAPRAPAVSVACFSSTPGLRLQLRPSKAAGTRHACAAYRPPLRMGVPPSSRRAANSTTGWRESVHCGQRDPGCSPNPAPPRWCVVVQFCAHPLRSAGSTTSRFSCDEARQSRLTGWRCACPSQRTVRSLPLDDGWETRTRLNPPAGRTPLLDRYQWPACCFRPGPPPALLVWAAVSWAGECQAGGADILAAVSGGYGGMPLAGERGQ